VAEHHLSLAVNGRESPLHGKSPLLGKSPRIIGIDVSERRLRDIGSRQADLT